MLQSKEGEKSPRLTEGLKQQTAKKGEEETKRRSGEKRRRSTGWRYKIIPRLLFTPSLPLSGPQSEGAPEEAFGEPPGPPERYKCSQIGKIIIFSAVSQAQ